MKRLVLLPTLALVLVACQDLNIAPDTEAPAFRLVDGRDGATAAGYADAGDFYFHPPIVPSPTTDANWDPTQFNPGAEPFITISKVADFGVTDDFVMVNGFLDVVYEGCIRDETVGAVSYPIVHEFTPDSFSVSLDTYTFQVGWKTGDEGFPTDENGEGHVYRLCAFVGEGENTKLLGFRDVRPLDNPDGGSRDTGQDPIYDFNNGRNLPLAITVNAGANCEPGAGPTIADCDEFVATSAGATGICEAGSCGVEVPAGVITEGESVLISIVRFDGSLQCEPSNDGTIEYIPGLDLPQYEGCLDVDVTPLSGSFSGFGGDGIVIGACVSSAGLSAAELDGLQLHHQYVVSNTTNTVIEVLPNAPFPGIAQEVCQGAPSSGSPLLGALRDGLHTVARALFPGLVPERLVASDVGFGGRTSFPAESPIVWAQPAAMSGSMSSTGGASGTSSIFVLDDETVTVTVNVLGRPLADFGDVHGEPVDYPVDVEGATVHFSAAAGVDFASNPNCAAETGGGYACLTDSNGNVTLDWTFSSPGEFSLTASGYGIGDPTTGPFGVHVGDVTEVELIGTGTLTFAVEVCGNGFATINVTDSEWDREWDCAGGQIVPFEANISDVPPGNNAEMRWVNDGEYLYFAMRLQQPEVTKDINVLSIQFDNDGDGNDPSSADYDEVELHDDLIEMEAVANDAGTAAESVELRDLWVNASCVNGQSVCGEPDSELDVMGNWYRYQDCPIGTEDCLESEKVWFSVYEMAHKYNEPETTEVLGKVKGQVVVVETVDPSDILRAPGDPLGAFIFLRYGKGAQGNTQKPEDADPDFGKFIPIVIH